MNELTPEMMDLIEQLAAGGLAEDEQGVLSEQLRIADEMRKTRQPGGRTVRDQYVAQNPLETVAATMNQIQGGQGVRDTLAQSRANMGTTAKGFKAAVMAEMLRRKQAEAVPAPTGTVGGLPTPPAGVPFAQTPPWEDPWYPGFEEPPAPRQARKPPPPAPGGPKSYGTTGSW